MEYREFVCAAIETMNQKEGKNGIQAREHRAVKNNGKIRVGLLLQETGSNHDVCIGLFHLLEQLRHVARVMLTVTIKDHHDIVVPFMRKLKAGAESAPIPPVGDVGHDRCPRPLGYDRRAIR